MKDVPRTEGINYEVILKNLPGVAVDGCKLTWVKGVVESVFGIVIEEAKSLF